ncbi:SCO7613 C-terminal domain-containing membrane protein [Glycomyces tarimensis]
MTTFNCPRCGQASTPERCPSCGRGPEPLLARLAELDAALRVLSPLARSRGVVEAERHEVLGELGRLAAALRAAETPPSTGTQSPASPYVPTASQTPPMPPPPEPARAERGEVGSKTVQTVLLALGGLLVAAAIIIFTAVAWRHLGDTGRLAILGSFTALMLAIPVALGRSRLSATAETFATLAALAMWCSALAGYYQYLPPGASLSAEAVGTWTLLVLAVLAAYRAAVTVTAAGWALLPLAAVGSAFAATGEVFNAALIMGAIAVVLASASSVVANRPSGYTGSDLWASRLLLCGGVLLAFLAGLRLAFGLSDAWVPPIAAAVAVLAAGNLLATLYARRADASLTTMLMASSATASLIVAAWVLAIRSGDPALAIPSLALLAAVAAVLIEETDDAKTPTTPANRVSAVALIATLAGFAIVAAGAPELTAYLAASVLIGLIAPLFTDPLRTSLRHAAYIGSLGVGAAGALIALSGLPVVLWYADAPPLLTWEVPIVLVLLGSTAPLVPRPRRLDLVATALTFAIVAAASLMWREGTTSEALAVAAFALTAVIALILALGSPTLSGRCTGWSLLTLWLPVTAGAALASGALGDDSIRAEFGLVVAAAAMLVTAAGAPRRSRPDRVLAAVLAHVLAGSTVAMMTITEWFGALIGSEPGSKLLPAAIGVYTLALVGVALMAPVKQWSYAIAAMCTGAFGWWTLMVSYAVETLEWFTVPPALALSGLGLWRLLRRPESGSWPILGTAIALGLGPSLLMALAEDDLARRVGVGAAAVAVVVAGLARRWQAPLVLGSITLLALTANELSLVWHAIPVWIPPAIGGAVLIAAGATFERRRRDLGRLRDGLKSMR